jgi:GTPase involved in cell partitioning and DNA repair
VCGVRDLSREFHLERSFDCVLSLEVGEHIPEEFAETFLDNLCRHASRHIILSWAVPGQGGHGHVNCRSNAWVRQNLAERGFAGHPKLENQLRAAASLPWFKETLMVFERELLGATLP